MVWPSMPLPGPWWARKRALWLHGMHPIFIVHGTNHAMQGQYSQCIFHLYSTLALNEQCIHLHDAL